MLKPLKKNAFKADLEKKKMVIVLNHLAFQLKLGLFFFF